MGCLPCLLLLFIFPVVFIQGKGITRQHEMLMQELKKMEGKMDNVTDIVKGFTSALKQPDGGKPETTTEKPEEEEYDEYDEDYEEEEADEGDPDIPTASNEWGANNPSVLAKAEEKRKQEEAMKKTQQFLKNLLSPGPGSGGLLFGG